MQKINTFFNKHMSTRKKEILFGLLFPSLWLTMVSDIHPTILSMVLFYTLLCLTLTVGISLISPLNEKKWQTDPPFIGLILGSKEKNKWMVFFLFLAVLSIDIFCSAFLPKSELARWLFLFLIGCSSVIFLELFNVWRKW